MKKGREKKGEEERERYHPVFLSHGRKERSRPPKEKGGLCCARS